MDVTLTGGTILVIAGIVILALAIIGRIEGKIVISVPQEKQHVLEGLGIILLGIGIYLEFNSFLVASFSCIFIALFLILEGIIRNWIIKKTSFQKSHEGEGETKP